MTDTEQLQGRLGQIVGSLSECTARYQQLLGRQISADVIVPALKADLERQISAFCARAGLKVGERA